MKKKGQLTQTWLKAKNMINTMNYDVEQLQNTLDTGILYLSVLSEQGVKDKDLVEGVKKEVWHERFWISTEKYIWTTYADYEENWKCD